MSAHQIIHLHFTLPWKSSSFTSSMNPLCGLSLLLLPGSSTFNTLCPIYPSSTHPNHVRLVSRSTLITPNQNLNIFIFLTTSLVVLSPNDIYAISYFIVMFCFLFIFSFSVFYNLLISFFVKYLAFKRDAKIFLLFLWKKIMSRTSLTYWQSFTGNFKCWMQNIPLIFHKSKTAF